MDPEPSFANIAQCYCLTHEVHPDMILCSICKKRFHRSCLLTGNKIALEGDVFFYLTCQTCSSNNRESVIRRNIKWKEVVGLALFNLQLKRNGPFNRSEICEFIYKNWVNLFGPDREGTMKTNVHSSVKTTLYVYLGSLFHKVVLGKHVGWSFIPSRPNEIEEYDTLHKKKYNQKRPTAFEAKVSTVLEESKILNQSDDEAPEAVKKMETGSQCDVGVLKLKVKDASGLSYFLFKQKRKRAASDNNSSSSSHYKGKESTEVDSENDLKLRRNEMEIDLDPEGKDKLLEMTVLKDGSESLNSPFVPVFSEINYEEVNVNKEYDEGSEERNNSGKVADKKQMHQHPSTTHTCKAFAKDECHVKEIINSDPSSIKERGAVIVQPAVIAQPTVIVKNSQYRHNSKV